jgi:Raf kinase inhibitor-like YbhB/YbcL family protein
MDGFVLTSPAFRPGGRIPRRHTCEGEDVSPALVWANLPAGTKELALVVEDPDAPGGIFVHWAAWGLPGTAEALAEGESAPGEGRNDFATIGYRGPCPPRRHGPHRYVFRLYALGSSVAVPPGAGKAELLEAIEAHVLGVAELVGTYER